MNQQQRDHGGRAEADWGLEAQGCCCAGPTLSDGLPIADHQYGGDPPDLQFFSAPVNSEMTVDAPTSVALRCRAHVLTPRRRTISTNSLLSVYR